MKVQVGATFEATTEALWGLARRMGQAGQVKRAVMAEHLDEVMSAAIERELEALEREEIDAKLEELRAKREAMSAPAVAVDSDAEAAIE